MASPEQRPIPAPIPNSMNTYRLESRKPFHADLVYKVLKEIVRQECQGIAYDPVKCSELVTALSAKIRNKVKLLEFERYRLVVFVEVGEKRLQGLQLVAKCLWDATRDNFATYTYQNTTLFHRNNRSFNPCPLDTKNVNVNIKKEYQPLNDKFRKKFEALEKNNA